MKQKHIKVTSKPSDVKVKNSPTVETKVKKRRRTDKARKRLRKYSEGLLHEEELASLMLIHHKATNQSSNEPDLS